MDVEKRPPVPAKCGIRYDDYVFEVRDESGSIRVETTGTCRVQGVLEVREGDRVRVEGLFIQPLSDKPGSQPPFIFTKSTAIMRLPQ